MLVKFNEWKQIMQSWADTNNTAFNLSKNCPGGRCVESYTIDIRFNNIKSEDIVFSQSANVAYKFVPSYIKFEYIDKHICNFDLSLYQKGFFERIFSSGRRNIGNRLFDKKFGVYSSNNKITFHLFNNRRVQDLFLNNKFLILNIQKENSTVILKSMETRLYKEAELQDLLDSFIYIVNIIRGKNG